MLLGFTEARHHTSSHFFRAHGIVAHLSHHVSHHSTHHAAHHFGNGVCEQEYRETTNYRTKKGRDQTSSYWNNRALHVYPLPLGQST